MIKGIYICENIDSMTGIIKKVDNQFSIMNNQFDSMKYVYEKKRNFLNKIIHRMPFIDSEWSELNEITDSEIIDTNFVYIRKPIFLTKFFVKKIKKWKTINPDLKILLEIPTYPYDLEFNKNFSNYFLILKDKYWRKKIKFIDRIVTFSDDLEIFGVKTIIINNAVNFNEITVKNSITNNETIRMVAVASICEWHGYDRIIKSVGEYYKNLENTNFIPIYLDIVGDGDHTILDSYNQLIKEYGIDNYVKLHGLQTGEKLNEIFNKASIGIDSLGRHRSGIYYNSSLKGKEYLARGLPIVSGVKTDLDEFTDLDFYFRIPANDTVPNLLDIINWYNFLIKNHANLNSDIRKFGENNFSYSKAYEKIFDYIKNS